VFFLFFHHVDDLTTTQKDGQTKYQPATKITMSPLYELHDTAPSSFHPKDDADIYVDIDEGLCPQLDSSSKPSESLPSFLPASSFSDSDGSEGGIFIEDPNENPETWDRVTREEEGEQAHSSSVPSRSILKTSLEESIPICTRKKSWSKLPVPDLEFVKLKRAESLSSFFCLESLSLASFAPRRIKKVDSKVSFQNITIREYEQTIGDNPSVGYGTPISLGWNYGENDSIDIDLYEANRGSRRSNRQMYLNHYQRKNLLIHRFGHTEEEVKDAKRATSKVRSQREISKTLQTSLRPLLVLEEMRESAVRKYKRRSEKKEDKSEDTANYVATSLPIGKRNFSSVSF
jgi:hypothetical protein